MNRAGSIWALAGLVAGLAAGAAGQKAEPTPLPTAAAAAAPLRLTLGTAPLRATMERWRVSWLYPASLPDVRLKVDRPAWTDPSENESESRLRAVEFRLPQKATQGVDAQTQLLDTVTAIITPES